jgi:hypothetical protein
MRGYAGVEVGNVGAQVALQPDCTQIQPLPCTLIADVDDNGQHTYTAYSVNFEHHISKITYLKSYCQNPYVMLLLLCKYQIKNLTIYMYGKALGGGILWCIICLEATLYIHEYF